jgi:hypothetical protein
LSLRFLPTDYTGAMCRVWSCCFVCCSFFCAQVLIFVHSRKETAKTALYLNQLRIYGTLLCMHTQFAAVAVACDVWFIDARVDTVF